MSADIPVSLCSEGLKILVNIRGLLEAMLENLAGVSSSTSSLAGTPQQTTPQLQKNYLDLRLHLQKMLQQLDARESHPDIEVAGNQGGLPRLTISRPDACGIYSS